MDAAELIAAAQEGIAKSDLQFDPALQRYFDPDLNLYYDPNDRRYTLSMAKKVHPKMVFSVTLINEVEYFMLEMLTVK